MTGPMDQDQPAAPPPASTPPPADASESWSQPAAPPPPTPAQGTAGYVYADVPNRAIAYIIDAIILAIVSVIIGIVLGAVGLAATSVNPNPTGLNDLIQYNFIGGIVSAIVFTAINGAYFIYTWTTMRGSPGQKVLGMQVGNAADGATLTMDQAIKRWIALGAPFGIAQALNPLPGLGLIIGLAALVWFIALLVTTAQSPTKQGLHDQYANTVVVKAARSVG